MKITLKQALIHLSLFLVTFVTTTLAGAEWTYSKSVFMPDFTFDDFLSGMSYSVPFLLILTIHEFGHYFTAIHHKVRTTLPYYIPLPPPLMLGTLGALIRLGKVQSKMQHFDIGIAGPLAGFLVAIGVLVFGFTHLPPPEYIFQIHPEYQQYGLDYAKYVYQPEYLAEHAGADILIGKNLIFMFVEKFASDPAGIPNVHELMHYPYLFAGLLALVITSINLLPIGQLDGGHILYGLLGFRGHKVLASVVFMSFVFYAGLGVLTPESSSNSLIIGIPLLVGFYFICFTGMQMHWQNTLMYAVAVFTGQFVLSTIFPGTQGYPNWFFFAFVIGRFVGVLHPPSEIEQPLDTPRVILGWIALAIFVITFAPKPLEIVVTAATAQ
ncbi:MAG: site-2 protease family protein [Cyclobacteriaceae bacterium]|nr:site-2 protease family protein [Cyclobacteriaceae bacterium]